MDCLFCKFASGDLETSKVFENSSVLGFKDINPSAKEHYLFIHKNHSENILDMPEKEVTEVFLGLKEFLKNSSMKDTGFRIVNNTGKEGGQTIFHTHFHLLGGEQLKGFGH